MSSEEAANEQENSAETPELSEEGKEKVRKMQEAYNDDRPTAVLPGTNNTITGVAVNEWLDDEGNPKFGQDEQKQRQGQNDDEQQQRQGQNDDEQQQRQGQNDDEQQQRQGQNDTENA